MFIDKDFQFRVNISNDFYVKKTDATACLSRVGAKAIGKEKMAFREYDVTVDQFLRSAINGYTFCNLFQFDHNKKYWIEIGDGRREYSYPVYQNGPNQGCMKLSFKRDQFFSGAQTVFVDIDLTRFESIPDYLACLTYPPTCVYMSYSDGLEKSGKTSRRFRMVYVFDRILGKDDLEVVSRCITDSIVRDTGEPMEDDCGERPSQYFNGVYGNEECYATYYIYSRLEFPEDLPYESAPRQALSGQNTSQPTVEFDPRLLHDMGTLDYNTFMRHNSRRYCYFYRTERAEWIDGIYQLTDDSYLQLWWLRERITDGNHRRRTLFKFACLRRLINPYVDANTLLFNMYLDFHRFIDNSDHIITLDTLTRGTTRAMLMTYDQLREYCKYEINYWRDHRPKFIMHPKAPKSQAFINFVTKRIHYAELDLSYDRTKSVQENAAVLGISPATLYRYCNDRYIETNPGKGQTYVQKRQAKKQAKADKKATFMLYYDPNLSAAKNRENMLKYGLDVTESTIRNWSKEYITEEMITPPKNEGPAFNFEPIHYNVPSYNNSWRQLQESNPYLADLEARWRKACES
jgi:hypothetical protein